MIKMIAQKMLLVYSSVARTGSVGNQSPRTEQQDNDGHTNDSYNSGKGNGRSLVLVEKSDE